MADIKSPYGTWSQGTFTANDGTKYDNERGVLADAPNLGELLRGLFGAKTAAATPPLPPKRPAGLGAKPADPNAFKNTEPGYSGVSGAILSDALNGPEPGFSGEAGNILLNATTPPEPGFSGRAGNTMLNASTPPEPGFSGRAGNMLLDAVTPPEPGYSGLAGNALSQDPTVRGKMMRPGQPRPNPFAVDPNAGPPAMRVYNMQRTKMVR